MSLGHIARVVFPRVESLEARKLLDAGDVSQVAVANMDGDGLADIAEVVPNLGPTTGGTVAVVEIYHNNGDGTQSLRSQIALPGSANPDSVAIAAGDLDGDGRPDLAYKLFSVTGQPTPVGEALVATEDVGILVNSMKGDFSRGHVERLAIKTKGTSAKREADHGGIAIADVDGDSVNDIVDWTRTSFSVLLGDGHVGAKLGTTSSNPMYKESGRGGVNPLYEGRIHAVADLDGDGRADFIGSDGSTSQWPMLVWTPVLGDGKPRAIEGLETRSPIERVIVADLDRDGYADLVVQAGQTLYVGMNDAKLGGGVIRWRPAIVVQGPAQDLLVGDIDGDGAADLFSVLSSGKHEMAKATIQNIRA